MDDTQFTRRVTDLPRTVGFWGAVAVMIGVIIGNGIFAQPTVIAKYLSDPWLVLSFWAIGGAVALCGALSFAELIAMFPNSGGIYVFIREGYGRSFAFVFGWTYLLIVKPSAAAGIAVFLGKNVNRLFGVDWNVQIQTVVVLFVLTLVNVLGTKLGTSVAMLLTSIKFGALAMIVVLALALGKGDAANFEALPATTSLWAAIVPVMAAVMWTYDGWSDVGAIAGEVKNPQKTLPRIFLVGTIAITALYLAVNAVYLWMIPLREQAQVDTLATTVMEKLLGPQGAVAVTALVVISVLGSTQSSIMTGARVTYQQSRDGLLFGWLGTVHPRFQTPAVGLWIQCALSCAAVLVLESFERLTGTFTFTMWIFYGLAGSVIFLLRVRLKDATRPFRCVGYPVVPAIFVASAVFMTAMSIATNPKGTLPWIGVLAAGFPVYAIWNRLVQRSALQKQSDPR